MLTFLLTARYLQGQASLAQRVVARLLLLGFVSFNSGRSDVKEPLHNNTFHKGLSPLNTLRLLRRRSRQRTSVLSVPSAVDAKLFLYFGCLWKTMSDCDEPPFPRKNYTRPFKDRKFISGLRPCLPVPCFAKSAGLIFACADVRFSQGPANTPGTRMSCSGKMNWASVASKAPPRICVGA